MFFGEFYHTLDDKGRLTMPSNFRKLLIGDGAFALRGFDQNLMIVTSTSFRVIYERINQMSMTDPVARLLRRRLFSAAAEVDFDKTGRILLPPYLREVAGITNEAVFVGNGDYIEVWSPDQWANQKDQLNNISADQFTALDLSSR